MERIIFIVVSCIIAYGLFSYMQKRKENRTPMGISLKRSMIFSLIALVSYDIGLLGGLAGLGFIESVGNTVMGICTDWILYFLWFYAVKFTNMEEKMKFRPIEYALLTLVGIDNLLLILQKQPVHLILYAAFIIAITVLLFAKRKLAPAIYARKYSSVFCAFAIVAATKIAVVSMKLSVDITIFAEAFLLMFLYFITFEHKQNDFVQRMQMLIVEDLKSPLLLFDYEHIIANYNQNADGLFKLSGRYEIDVAAYTLEDFIKENGFYMIKDINKDARFEWAKNGSHYSVEYRWLYDHKNMSKRVGVLFSFRDVTAEKKAAWEMEYMLTHDHLTGLYNRNYLRINEKNLVDKVNYPISIALVNINGTKMINDFYGTGRGDKIIVGVGEILQGNIREKDVPVRLDGDEFMIIMPKTEEKEAVGYLEAISGIVAQNVNPEMGVTVEFGVGSMADDKDTLESSMKMAKNTMYQKKMLSGKGVRSSILESLKKALSESDFETEEHAERTKRVAVQLGEKLHLSDKEKSELGLLAILHDIGKLSIPDEVLKKPGKLNEEEWEIMKSHTFKGYEIANTTPELIPIAKYILHHHERWDGKGYPSGLAGHDIPLLSRIITLVDSYDVMTHDRPYHKAMSAKEAKEEVIRCSGTQFDPEIAKVFLQMLEEER